METDSADRFNSWIFGMLKGSSDGFALAYLRSSPDCVKLLSTDGRINFMSENGMCAMQIDAFESIKGAHWWTLWPEELRETLQRAVKDAAGGESVGFDGACPTAKGEPRQWSVTVSPVRAGDGSITSLLAVSRDVTSAA